MKKLAVLLAVLTSLALVFTSVRASHGPVFLGGDIFQGFNNTTQEGTWRDPVSAAPGQILQFRIWVENIGDADATNVNVKVNLPADRSLNHQPTVTITADNAETRTDTVTVNVTGSVAQNIVFLSGHTEMGKEGQHVDLPETITTSGVNIGTIKPGINNRAEVTFKAGISNFLVAAPPEPAPPPPAPAPAPPPPPAGVSQQQEVNVTQQQQVSQNVSVQGAAAPAPQVQAAPRPAALPKAGAEALPALSGLAAVGWYLRRRYLLV